MSYRDREAPVIEAYPTGVSVAPGEAVGVCCSSDTREVAVEVARVGGTREVVWTSLAVPTERQAAPADAAAHGCGWDVTFEIAVGYDWRSGYYEVVLRGRDEATGLLTEALTFFVVRPTSALQERARRMLLVLATNTYAAYNDWGGHNLYTGGHRASLLRPWAPGLLSKPEPHMRYPNVDGVPDPDHQRFRHWTTVQGLSPWSGSSGWHNWERPFVQWAERAGYALDVAVNSDLELHPDVVDGYPLVVSVGHDEYWSWGMRDTLEAYIARGGNCAFFSGNSVCWQARIEDGGAAVVSYKTDYAEDPVLGTDQEHLLTTAWCSARVGRPENHLTGVTFSRGGYIKMGQAVPHGSGGYTVWRPEHWIFAGTGVRYGDVVGAHDQVAVYEVDGCELTVSPDTGLPVPTGADGTPATFEVLASAPARLWDKDEQPSRYRPGPQGDLEWMAEEVFGEANAETIGRLAHNHAVLGVYTRGGTVVTTGATDWSYGLAGHDPVIEQMTRNVLDRLGQPSP
ncbi:MAG: hypothetical protein AVDCRST_MAG34-1741 [uncultured Nocardioidaceae bacterium]|uniref:N,N-dimethylformamidase beta subunit-like C-terminal domain-containing protein n=1 Tax=uncultured Nocardioidaceae bacterium TaxID=253824 RepID=A0A6J4M5B8_9ACTN|nr:MAG: hypothetical protein AVDCRST_MAG34-1741 [uncultured Nocardioidaceae bacterium]